MTTDYEYDTQGSQTMISDTRTLTYDENGNRESLLENSTTYNYTVTANTNRLAATAGPSAKTYTFDAAGNVTDDSVHNYVYDDRGRLISVDSSSVTYEHNGQGQRVKKDDGTDETLFVYDEAGQLIGEYDDTGAAILEHVWFNGASVAVIDGANEYYVHTDHLGTPRIITDGNTTIWRWESRPFGEDGAQEDPDGDSTDFTYNLRFAGQYFDVETGLHYNYYRTYDPSTGRYLESDPIGLASGLNTYAYVSNMPTMLTDRFGLYEGDGTAPYFGEDWDRTYPPGYTGWQPLPPCKHPFLQRALDRFATTNQALPGLLAPTGLGILTAGSMGRATGSPTFLQLLQTMRTGEFVSGAARLTRLEAAISAGGLSVVNTAYAGLAFESGVAAGSLIGAAILPCERETEDECSK